MQANRISAQLSQADLDAVMAAIETIKQKLPFLISLTPEQIRNMSKIGDSGQPFTHRALEVAIQNPEIMPRGFDIDEFRKDVELFNSILTIRIALEQLLELVQTTHMLVGSEAYAGGLDVYLQVRNSREGLGLESALDDLGQRFARKSRKKPEDSPDS